DDLRPTLGTYFILGNHDALKMAPVLTGMGYVYLKNQSVILAPPTHALAGVNTPPPQAPGCALRPRLALIGLDQHRRIDTDFPKALREVKSEDFKLILLHYPDLIHQAAAAGADVCLAGHTHGGQICWPDGHPIIRHDVLPQAMCTGVHKVADTWMVVNRGIGKAGLRIRVFCPPQAIMLTLRKAATIH
ncbi:MAG: metallophosphoesterase, partial [Phycisphaerae bacterium]